MSLINTQEKINNLNYKTTRLVKQILYKNKVKQEVCERCNCTNSWNNIPLVLQLHHIDGDHNNNSIENLQILCPNCHSQTDNFRRKKKINDKEIIDACNTSASINEVIHKLKKRPSGGIYKRIENVINLHNLPLKKYNYNKVNSTQREPKIEIEKNCECCNKPFRTNAPKKRFCSRECVATNASNSQIKWTITDLPLTIGLVKAHGWTKAAEKLKVECNSTPGALLRLAVKREIKKQELDIDIYSLSKFKNRARKW
jgi:hypothetical protein